MPTSVPAGKAGLRDYLRTIPGLTQADKLVIRSAPVAPEEMADRQLTLGDVTAPQARAGLARKEETPTLTCWLRLVRPGADEAAIDQVRNEIAGLLQLVEGALLRDPTAAGTIPPPGGTRVTSSTLEEFPAFTSEGTAGRGAQYQFQITWVSHIV
jgi:hypothetical protein